MTQRLPIPGGDDDTWGDILNGFLEVSLNADGTLANNTVGTNQVQNNAVTNAQLDSSTQSAITKANSSVQTVNSKTGPTVTLAASDVSAIPTSQLGAASGVATLDGSSTLTAAQLPSSVVFGSWLLSIADSPRHITAPS
jgi:hypothetical protein